MGKALAIIGLLAVLVLTAACSGAKSVTITGPDAVTTKGDFFTATAEGATPLYGQVVFAWYVNGSQFGEAYVRSVDASGTAQDRISWKPSARMTAAFIEVVASFVDPGSIDYPRAYDSQLVTVVR